MMTDTPRATRYALSFTSGALLMREALVAAPVYLRERDWAKVRQLIDEDNLLQARTVATGRRLARETAQRLSVLAENELELLVDTTTSERGHLLWAAACRRYHLIGEFAEEVLRERFLLLTPTLDHDDFDGFILSKALWHDEIANLKSSTVQRLRSNLFQMLVEAGLLTEDGRILQAVLSTRVSDALSARTPSDIRFFPTGVGKR
jgi:bacteriophage exclusion system BrxA-like protein